MIGAVKRSGVLIPGRAATKPTGRPVRSCHSRVASSATSSNGITFIATGENQVRTAAIAGESRIAPTISAVARCTLRPAKPLDPGRGRAVRSPAAAPAGRSRPSFHPSADCAAPGHWPGSESTGASASVTSTPNIGPRISRIDAVWPSRRASQPPNSTTATTPRFSPTEPENVLQAWSRTRCHPWSETSDRSATAEHRWLPATRRAGRTAPLSRPPRYTVVFGCQVPQRATLEQRQEAGGDQDRAHGFR